MRSSSKPRNPSVQLPAYSAETISSVLRAYQISHQPNDNYHSFHLYAYPLKLLTKTVLAEESIAYFLLMKKNSKARRVSFLLKRSDGELAALIVQCSKLDENVLNNLISLTQNISAENFLRDVTLRNLLKKLYGETHCLFISLPTRSDLVAELKVPITQAYTNRVQLDLMSLPIVNPSIALAQHILTMLIEGKTSEVETAVIFSHHRAQCVEYFFSALSQLKTHNHSLYPALQQNIIVALKYLQLNLSRHQYSSLPTTEILNYDHQVKRKIYAQAMDDLKPYLNLFDLVPLCQLLTDVEEPEKLLKQIQHVREIQYQQMKDWENHIQNQMIAQQKNWNTYLPYQSWKASNFIYHYSLIGLGAELFQWMGKHFLTLNSSSHSSEWTKKIVLNLFKLTGILLAIIFTYTTGFIHFTRQLMVSQLARQGNQHFVEDTIDDTTASIISRQLPCNIKLTQSACLYITIAIVTALETIFSQNTEPSIRAVCGLSASFALTALAKHFIEDLRTAHNQPPTEDQIFTLFLLSNAGYSVGQIFAGIVLDRRNILSDTLQSRAAIIAQLQALEAKGILLDLTIDDTSSVLTRLFHSEMQLCIEWRNASNGFFHQTHCKIAAVNVNCSKVTMSSPRLKL